MRGLVLTVCLAVALPVLVFGQTIHTVTLSKRILPDSAQYHGSKLLDFAGPAAGAITVPPQWSAVEMAVIADNPKLQPAVAVRFRDDRGAVQYAVATDGRMIFDSTSVLQFHSSGDRRIADFAIPVRPGESSEPSGRSIAYRIDLSNNRVIARLAECRDGTLRLGDQDYDIRIYAPAVDNPFFDLSTKAVFLIDMNHDGTYAWKWRLNDSDRAVLPSERIALTGPFSVDGSKLKAVSIDPAGTVFTCSDYSGDTAAVVGFLAPEFSVKDMAGSTHTLAEMKGHVVLVTFWSTGCHYCEKIRPQLDTLIASSDTAQFQAICAAVDADTSAIADFLHSKPWGGIVAPYAAPLWNAYNPRMTTPVYYVIDRDGSVLFMGAGASVFAVAERIVAEKLSSAQ